MRCLRRPEGYSPTLAASAEEHDQEEDSDADTDSDADALAVRQAAAGAVSGACSESVGCLPWAGRRVASDSRP